MEPIQREPAELSLEPPRRLLEDTTKLRLRAGIAVLALLVVVGVFGFRWFGEMGWIDALYMTITTLATVGYGEVQPLDAKARLFAVFFIVVGVGATLYTAGALAEFLIAGRVSTWIRGRTMDRRMDELEGHVIVCGYGRLGRVVGAELSRAGVEQVIVDRDPAVGELLAGTLHPFLVAPAEEEGVLERAGVARARAIVAATASEAVNVFTALGARELNPAIAIYARAESEAGARRLRRAGATLVVSPHHLGGQRLAQAILRPAVVDFLELTGTAIDLEEVVVGPGSALAALRVEDLASHGVRVAVVAIKRGGAPIALQPPADTAIGAGDRIVVVGDRASVNRLAEIAAGSPPAGS
jgi:voltage-gated potassium channel